MPNILPIYLWCTGPLIIGQSSEMRDNTHFILIENPKDIQICQNKSWS